MMKKEDSYDEYHYSCGGGIEGIAKDNEMTASKSVPFAGENSESQQHVAKQKQRLEQSVTHAALKGEGTTTPAFQQKLPKTES